MPLEETPPCPVLMRFHLQSGKDTYIIIFLSFITLGAHFTCTLIFLLVVVVGEGGLVLKKSSDLLSKIIYYHKPMLLITDCQFHVLAEYIFSLKT